MTKPRYLTKSRFKLGMECPAKLYYTGKKEYPDQSMDDSFLAALAEGGFQVGELAKAYHPGGHDIEALDYASWIRREQLHCNWVHFPIPDYGTPKDLGAFYALADELAAELCNGSNLLLHCSAGVGRTGMLACCIAQELGEPIQHVFDTQSVPTRDQMEIVHCWKK